jgi:hypothetical protein
MLALKHENLGISEYSILKGHNFTGCEKIDSGRFCNKGTTLVGPQMLDKKGWALAPEGRSSQELDLIRSSLNIQYICTIK